MIYFKLILCIINPFIKLKNYNNFNNLKGLDSIEVKHRRGRVNKILFIKITKSNGERGHRTWYFEPTFK